jgi:hypothetical protein
MLACMSGSRIAAVVAAAVLILAAGTGEASASKGGGGGGGTPPPPTTAPVATFTSLSAGFGSVAVGTTSAAQSITVTDTGTAPLFFNGFRLGGTNAGDFVEGDTCVGISIQPGTTCTIGLQFRPTATGSRTGTLTVLDSAANSPQVITLSGVGTSVNGPTPISVDPGGLPCTGGVCDLGENTPANDFYFASFTAAGDFTLPLTWTIASGTVPTGTVLRPDGILDGVATTIGTFTFTVRVTDANGKTGLQAFTTGIIPVPAAGDPGCQHAPSSSNAQLTGPAIGGKTPQGQALGDQSKLTACGGFITLNISVKNVNLPDGTVLWVTVDRVVGTITLKNGAGTMRPYVLNSDLRKKAAGVSTSPFAGGILGGAFF